MRTDVFQGDFLFTRNILKYIISSLGSSSALQEAHLQSVG